MAANSIPYDPRFMEFDHWAALMCELYGAQNLEIPTHGTEWTGWAVGLMGIDIFTNEALPNPYLYDDWREWAQHSIGVVNSGV
jgi:hypothetical protein